MVLVKAFALAVLFVFHIASSGFAIPQYIGGLKASKDPPISKEKLIKIVSDVDFTFADEASISRLAQVVKRETNLSMPNWFLLQTRRFLVPVDHRRNLGKPVFRFQAEEEREVLFFQEEEAPNRLELSCRDKKLTIDIRDMPELGYRPMGRSDFFIGLSSERGFFVFGDQPGFPLLCIGNDGNAEWSTSLFLPKSHWPIQIEIAETDQCLVCFVSSNEECSIQSFAKADGTTEFWWSTSLVRAVQND